MSVLIFFVILLVLVIVHEFGHFFTAKRFGIRVDEFGFGFPPKLFGVKKGETEYSFNALPFGGFVKIFGENPDEESIAGPDATRSLVNRPKWQQASVLFAGVFANFLLAWLLFSFALMSGFPMSAGGSAEKLEDVHLAVVSVIKDSPADKAGIEPGARIENARSGEDVLLEINPESLKDFVGAHAGKEIEIGYLLAGGEARSATMTPEVKDNTPMIGIAMDMIGIAKTPFLLAFWKGLVLTLDLAKSLIVGLYTLIVEALAGQGSLASITGPVGLVGIVGVAYKFGFTYLLSFTALISINLAVLNLIPFPALDGGRLFFLLVEKIKGSRIHPRIANAANAIGFALLILLMLAVTYHDIARLL
ncbi:MAG: site-2 protease family protein [Patescibacteria group bacterium]